MNEQAIVDRVATAILAADSDLLAVAEVVKRISFLSLRRPLEGLGIGKVDIIDGDAMIWVIRTRRGSIGIVSKNGASVGPGDLVVGNFIVGYL